MILVKMVSCCTIDIAQKLNIELKPSERWVVDLKKKSFHLQSGKWSVQLHKLR